MVQLGQNKPIEQLGRCSKAIWSDNAKVAAHINQIRCQSGNSWWEKVQLVFAWKGGWGVGWGGHLVIQMFCREKNTSSPCIKLRMGGDIRKHNPELGGTQRSFIQIK